MSILIKRGRVIDPANNVDEVLDCLVENGVIARVAKDIVSEASETIDATGSIVMPGLVDMHVHLREPGREDKETVLSGTKAALRGGVTSLLAMPNTTPAMDSPEALQLLKKITQKNGRVNVYLCGAMTRGRRGAEPTDIIALKKEGVVAVTDDGESVEDGAVMRQVLAQAAAAGIPAICHCEDKALSNQGVVNLGYMSTILGLRGISAESESKRVERDIALAEEAGAALHIAHVSVRAAVELIRKAKARGVKVTAECAPHHIALSEQALLGYDTNFKMSPPLRSQEDVASLIEALRDGTIDCIASDHAPHTEYEKEIEFDRAEFGVVGLETELSVCVSELIEKKHLGWSELASKFSLNPARILGIPRGTLSPGAAADIVVVDPDAEWQVSSAALVSKSKNSAFLGRTLKGVVLYTVVSGKLAYKA